MDNKHCAGCRNNFYNGNNNIGVEECWFLKSAKLVMRKRVPVTQRPPWDQKPERLPDCYTKPGYVFVGPDVRQ